MSSPRKFAEKIALLQQKQAEGDAAFNTILCEVEAAKQKTDRPIFNRSELDVSKMSNGMHQYSHHLIKPENTNGFDRLSLPADNSSWRRTYSDSSLHQSMNPTVLTHDNQQALFHFDMNETKFSLPTPPPSYPSQHFPSNTAQYPSAYPYDVNNNHNYPNDPTHLHHTQMVQQNHLNSMSYSPQTFSSSRYGGGNGNSNVLMLPPNPYSRNGGSLPDLRLESVYNPPDQTLSFSTLSSLSPTASLHGFRSPSPQENGDDDLFQLDPKQQQLTSNIGPLKSSANMRRRHSPMAKGRPSSRRHSPAPDLSPVNSTEYFSLASPSKPTFQTQQTCHRVEPQSPQSQSSYSPQNSPHFLPSPTTEHPPYSPQQQQQQPPGTDNHQAHYFALSNHFDQIKLENNYYPQQSPTHSSSGTSDFRPRNFGVPMNEEIPSTYAHHRSPTIGVKSPTIPDIILTDADNSKSDLGKDFVNLLDGSFDLQLNADDLLSNGSDSFIDQMFCDET